MAEKKVPDSDFQKMVSRLSEEGLVTPSEACTAVLQTPTSLMSIRRWMIEGARCRRTGLMVKLEGFKAGGVWQTSIPALKRFLEEINP